MNSQLDNLTEHNGPLAAEPPDCNEFNGLKSSGLARLHDAANTKTDYAVMNDHQRVWGEACYPVVE